MIPACKSYCEYELVNDLVLQKKDAFSYLYDNYSDSLFGSICTIVKDRDDAADVLQNVFLKIWKSIDMYDATKGKLFTWMMAITRNLILDYLRSKKCRQGQLTENLEYASRSLAVYPFAKPLASDIKKAVNKLKGPYKLLIELSFYHGYTQQEMSTLLQIPLGTIKTRISKSYKELRLYLQEY